MYRPYVYPTEQDSRPRYECRIARREREDDSRLRNERHLPWSRGVPADTDATYTTFPEGPNEWHDHFRHSWVLVRKRRIIDKLSMVSAELFGALELAVRKVIRSKHTHKLCKDESVRRFEEPMFLCSWILCSWIGGYYRPWRVHHSMAIRQRHRQG